MNPQERIKEQRCFECGHKIDDHLEQADGIGRAGECIRCKCKKYRRPLR